MSFNITFTVSVGDYYVFCSIDICSLFIQATNVKIEAGVKGFRKEALKISILGSNETAMEIYNILFYMAFIDFIVINSFIFRYKIISPVIKSYI